MNVEIGDWGGAIIFWEYMFQIFGIGFYVVRAFSQKKNILASLNIGLANWVKFKCRFKKKGHFFT